MGSKSQNFDFCDVGKSSQGTDSSSDEELVPTKKKKKEVVNWILAERFDDREQAEEAVKNENTWSMHYYHLTQDGKKKYYRCNKLKKRGPQCSAKLYLLIENTSDCVLMFKTEAQHDHDQKTEHLSSHGLSDSVKVEINKLYQLKIRTPKAVMQQLLKMTHIEPPKMSQVINYLSEYRKGRYGEPILSLEELEFWILAHTGLPADPHELFVISYQIDTRNKLDQTFRFAISTKHLTEIAKDFSVLHADTTHKMTWQGFPVFICGTTDKNKKFHPLCLAVTSKEEKEDFRVIFEGLQEYYENSWAPKVLVCDTAKSIRNAFIEVFGNDVVVRTCWANVRKKIKERLGKLKNKELSRQILGDIDALHSVTSTNIFDLASEAFLKKYEDQPEFIQYLSEQWLLQNRNWYLGAAYDSPSTNNALESFIRVIKGSDTIREKLPLSRFLEVIKQMVKQWSTRYTINPEENHVAKVPSISLKDWVEGYQWSEMDVEVTTLPLHSDENNTYYEIPAGEEQKCPVFDQPWKTFDEFKEQNFSKWLISLPKEKDDWLHGNCTCPAFFENYICKHVIGLAIRLKYIAPPVEAKNSPIGEKRKPGRPPKDKNR